MFFQKPIIFFFLLFSLPCVWAQNITVSNYYKVDRDGDGVPNVRDKCPDTDKNLNGQEFVVEANGTQQTVKIADLKKNFETRRRRLLVEISRLDKEKRAILKQLKNKRDKLGEEDAARVHELDSGMTLKKSWLADLVYEAKVQVGGKTEIIEVKIGVDEFGCLPDRDGDGVPDIVDKCPDTPGIRPLYGCSDRDGDGIMDHEDHCPDEPGLKRLHGCPDRGTGDRDKDGTVDKNDLCPDTPGPKSNKGCPELITEKDKEIIEQASKVLFDSGRATLRPESYAVLDQLADLILGLAAKHDKLKVRLEGHTDTDGANASNLTLSRDRSRAVKDYLVTKGIDIMTISTAGYGEDRLKVEPERTPADKQANRRVEIAITNQ